MTYDGQYARYTATCGAFYGSSEYNDVAILGRRIVFTMNDGDWVFIERGGYGDYSDHSFYVSRAGNAGSGSGNIGLPNHYWDLAYIDDVYATTHARSSREYKHDIADLPDMGGAIDALRPVSFVYNGETNTRYGLIWEDAV